MDRWTSLPVICKGGIHQELDLLTLGSTLPGAATLLQNYEPSIAGGYQRILGYTPWDTAKVPGDTNAAILGVAAAMGGVFAARHSTMATSNDIYFSSGSGWNKINTSSRTGTPTKVRMLPYALATLSLMITDGVTYAAKWDGTTYTVINGTGAPTNPKYSAFFNESIVLSGYGSGTLVSISAPTTDTDFNGADGAVEFNVGDLVTGIKTFRDTLYIFCQNSIYEITVNTSSTSPPYLADAVTKSLGCLAQDTIIEVGGDLIYLAPDGFRSLAATYRIGDLQLGLLSAPIHPLLNDTDFLIGNSNDSYSAVHVAAKNQYRAWVYNSSVPTNATTGILGRRIDDPVNVKYEWATTLGINPYCAHSQYINGQEIVVIGDPSSGYVYRLESGNDFNGTPIPYIYRSPDLTFNDATLRKVMQKFTVYTQIEGDTNVQLNVLLDVPYNQAIQPNSVSLVEVGALPVYGSPTAIYGTSIYSTILNPVFKNIIQGSGFLVAFQFSGTDSNPPHRIDSFQIEFTEKGRR